MPLLPPETHRYPADLFAAPLSSEPRRWWVLQTRPRQEKALSRFLLHDKIPFYLPVVARRFSWRRRIMTSHLPLFAGYLFLLGDREERLKALSTSRVANSLPVADQQSLWNDLRQVDRLIAAGAPLLPENRLAPGMKVEINQGPLAGLKGKIVRTASGRRFVVEVDFIQRGASVELDDFTLVKSD